MIPIYDRPSAERALACTLDPPIRAALEAELALLTSGEHDLTDWTDIIVVQLGDTEEEIVREAGFSPFKNPLSGLRFDEPGFEPPWNYLSLCGGVFRLVVTFGSTFATILLIPNDAGPLARLCRKYAA
ncbi:hypothetical protein [Sphingomonas radiodurans]|uniref:hypothetical protein n=1 Tax=Sphingomonas radiodurans TaxID=2890321 RepID=UPI001E3722D7|nr:hypothetical protein [Sphingomonas radiodurans]WBH15286.1 hypothetical protein LLW23_10550 [Sphingomonas radiodurans]